MFWASTHSSPFNSFTTRDWSAWVEKIKSKRIFIYFKAYSSKFPNYRAPQITLLFLIYFHIFVYIEHLLIWEFATELVNSISTLRKVGTQQVVEGGLLWSYKIISWYDDLVKPYDVKVHCDLRKTTSLCDELIKPHSVKVHCDP